MTETQSTYAIAPEIERAIIEQKLALWRNTFFDYSLDAKVAQAVDDAQGLERAKDSMKKAAKAIAVLESLLSTGAASQPAPQQ